MKVYKGLKEAPAFGKKTAVTIGAFDGIHIGHRALIRETVRCAAASGGKSILMTFKEHPDVYLKKSPDLKFIKNLENNIRRVFHHGIDAVIVADFRKISKMTAREFAEKVLAGRLNAGCVIVGRDFVFGKQAAGDVKLLARLGKELGFRAKVIGDVKVGGRKVSSTLIRNELQNGRIKEVEKMLGRKYSLSGMVLHGKHVGFEYPTANLIFPAFKMPARGVWAVRVKAGNREYTGAANIGFAPTLKKENKMVLEVHILDFHKDIYGREIEVVFLERLRDEKKFASKKILLKKVAQDIAYIRKKYMGRRGNK